LSLIKYPLARLGDRAFNNFQLRMEHAMKFIKSLIFLLSLVVALPVLAQMRPAPPPVGEGQLIEVTATVEEIDLEKRLITLKGPTGRVVISEVDPQVPNLDKVNVGDEVQVKYYRAALQEADKLDPDAKRGATVTEGVAVTGTVGDKPAGVKGREVRETVEVLLVDEHKKAIAFRGMDGKYREVSVDAPRLEHWLTDLEKGDKVRAAYREALVIMVEPK
jgi:hypothetical protein